MKEERKKRLVHIGVFLLSVCVSCSLPTHERELQNGLQSGAIEEHASLFEQNGSTYIFDTNDTAYIQSGGYTVWTRVKSDTLFSDFEVKTKKSAGESEAGYGVVFSESAEGSPLHSMLCVLINLEGKYAIGKIEKGVYKNIEWWKDAYEENTQNNRLHKGSAAQNTIGIKYEQIHNRYELFLNGYKIQNFEDTRKTAGATGRRGYAAVISSNELFPERNVRVEFREE